MLVPLLMLNPSVAEEPVVISIAAIDWCPQICINEKMKGYTVELVNKIFEGKKYTVKMDVFPWSRALKYVSDGRYDALLAPAKKEAPYLIYPKYSIGTQRMCFFTKAKDNWNYVDESSLKNKIIGIAKDASIEELNDYILQNSAQFQYQPYHERYVIQNAKKLLKGRIDTFVFTKNTTEFELAKANLSSKIRNAGCVSEAKIYLAFTQLNEKKEKITGIIEYFNQQMYHLLETGKVNEISVSYSLK
jgi:polar amino acid transport system substrate-binding protein